MISTKKFTQISSCELRIKRKDNSNYTYYRPWTKQAIGEIRRNFLVISYVFYSGSSNTTITFTKHYSSSFSLIFVVFVSYGFERERGKLRSEQQMIEKDFLFNSIIPDCQRNLILDEPRCSGNRDDERKDKFLGLGIYNFGGLVGEIYNL